MNEKKAQAREMINRGDLVSTTICYVLAVEHSFSPTLDSVAYPIRVSVDADLSSVGPVVDALQLLFGFFDRLAWMWP